MLALASAFAPAGGVAFACVGSWCWPRAGLQECVHVTADVAELVQCIIQGPVLGVQAGYLVPELAVGMQELMQVDGAQAGGCRHALCDVVEDLFVKGLERC